MKKPNPVKCRSCGKLVKFSDVKAVVRNDRGELVQLCECNEFLKFKREEGKK